MKEIFRIVDRPPGLSREVERIIDLVRKAVSYAHVEEIGSTALPGVVGKQDIDILATSDRGSFQKLIRDLDGRFKRDATQFSSPIYQAYVVESPYTSHIQATVLHGPHDTFRDFKRVLLSDQNLVSEYNSLKRRFDGQPMDAYRQAKSVFIERLLSSLR
jgi:GrpB-like predicted nucleotidyltransferase (UPF0157 family)